MLCFPFWEYPVHSKSWMCLKTLKESWGGSGSCVVWRYEDRRGPCLFLQAGAGWGRPAQEKKEVILLFKTAVWQEQPWNLGILIQIWSILLSFLVRCSWTSRDVQCSGFPGRGWAVWGFLEQFCCSSPGTWQTSVVLGNTALRGGFESAGMIKMSFCVLHCFIHAAVTL